MSQLIRLVSLVWTVTEEVAGHLSSFFSELSSVIRGLHFMERLHLLLDFCFLTVNLIPKSQTLLLK